MNCPMCNRELYEETGYIIFQSMFTRNEDTKSYRVCGQCFLLVTIKDILMEIKDGYNRKLQH